MDYIITKSPKSRGIAILLILIFGPIGLFYVSVRAGITMMILPIIAGIIIFFGLFSGNPISIMGTVGFVPVFIIVYWIICFVWALNALNEYNRKLETSSIKYEQRHYGSGEKENSVNNRENIVRSDFQEWSKMNPLKSVNDYYREHRGEILNIDRNRYNYAEDDDKPDIILIIYWIVGLIILTSIVLMYNTADQTFRLSNIMQIFN